MRTTVNLDDDVLFAVQERARRERRSVGTVLSELARSALTAPVRPSDESSERPRERYGFVSLPHRGEAVSNALIDRLREEEPE
jgi:hypothetical protein